MDYIVKVYKDWKLHSQFTEIVPDMDEDFMFNEKQSIRESARSLKKYGSTCNHVRNNETLIRHDIEKTDTLQGIALKYGCTTEQIRRSNRLFASDSLFLRQFLLIPVEKTSPFYPKDDRPQSLPARAYSIHGNELVVTAELQIQREQDQQNYSKTTSKSMESMSTLSPEEENKKSMEEFLGKIDSNIAESKKYVAKSKYNSADVLTNQCDDDIFNIGGAPKRRNTNSSIQQKQQQQHNNNSQQHTRHSSSGSTSDTAHLLNITHGKRVQTSLQRLEKQQDDFFEL